MATEASSASAWRRPARVGRGKDPISTPLSLVDTAPAPAPDGEAAAATQADVQQQGLGNAAIAARKEAADGREPGTAAPPGPDFAETQQGIGNAAVMERQAAGGGNGKDGKAGGAGGGKGKGEKDAAGGTDKGKDGKGGGAAPAAGGAVEAAPAAAGDGKAEEAGGGPAAGGGDAIQILGASLPANSATALASAQEAAAGEIEAERGKLAENPPSMEAPSGLGGDAAAEKGEGDEGGGEKGSAARIDDQQGEGQAPPPIDTSHEAAEGPLPAGPPIGPVVDRAPEDATARVEAYRQLLFKMPTSDDSVDTSAGPPPALELSAEADPGQYGSQEAENETVVAGENETAARDMQADEGVDAIFPTLPDAMLVAPVTPGGPGMEGMAEMEVPTLSPELMAGVNEGAASHWNAATADARVKHEQGLLDRQTKETDERASVEQQISELEESTAKDQLGRRATARSEVETARTAWRGEIDQARGAYDTERTGVREKLDRDVETRVGEAEGEAEGHLADGEAKAEAARVEAEADAAAKRAEAERKSEEEDDGFFGWIASKVKSFFNALKSALKAVFNALRKAVQVFIEGAKKLAAAAIELGRRAVVGFIKLAGAALELAADVFLAAFPEARARAKAAIRRGVAAAEEAVNRAAEALRAGVFALLDGLGKVLTSIIDAYEAVFSAILDVLEFLVVGMIEIMRGIARLGEAASQSGDHIEGQAYEELLGADLTQPLPFELTEAEAGQLEAGVPAEEAALPPELEPAPGAEAAPAPAPEAEGPTPTEIEVDPVVEDDLDPALLDEFEESDANEVEFGESADPGNSLAAIQAELGYEPAPAPAGPGGEPPAPVPAAGVTVPAADAGPGTAPAAAPEGPDLANMTVDQRIDEMLKEDPDHNCDTEAPTSEQGPPIPLAAKFGPLTKMQRARYMLGQGWKAAKQWLDCNWGKVIAVAVIAIVAIAALVVASVLTGGAVAAVAGTLLTYFTGAMAIIAIGRVLGMLGDYLEKSWKGDIAGGAKALARVVAVGIVEIVSAVLTYVTAGAFKVLSAAIKGATKAVAGAVKVITKGAAKVIKKGVSGTVKLLKKGLKGTTKVLKVAASKGGRLGGIALRKGKIVMKGAQKGFARGAKSIRDLGGRLAKKFRFKKFRLRLAGKWIILEGQINPWTPIAKMKASGKTRRPKAKKAKPKLKPKPVKKPTAPLDPHKGKTFTHGGKSRKIGDAPALSKTKKGKTQVTDIEGNTTTLRKPKEGFTKAQNPDGTATYTKGDKNLTYDADGFPLHKTKGDVHIDPSHVGSGKDAAHFEAANIELGKQLRADPKLADKLGLNPDQVKHIMAGKNSPPDGLSWHHHQNTGRMQLVDRELHNMFRHTGGMRIWGGGY